MWGAIFVFLVAIITGTIMTQTSSDNAASSLRSEANAIAGNMLVYRNSVVSYARANSTTSGTINDSALSLPTWYGKINGINNYVTMGKGYVYFSNPSSDLAYLILKSSKNSLNTGIKQGGNLINPINQTNLTIPIALPSSIPNGSVVYGP